jgi:hypothetical protein
VQHKIVRFTLLPDTIKWHMVYHEQKDQLCHAVTYNKAAKTNEA